jgi:hypothetical protein
VFPIRLNPRGSCRFEEQGRPWEGGPAGVRADLGVWERAVGAPM